MKKQRGFTLIELMVVMAIIAVLATAGLSAYTGYIKKARDAVRVADINAINKIILSGLSVTGMPPQTALEVYNLVKDANNGTVIMDPLASNNGLTTKRVCLGDVIAKTTQECSYTFRTCDNGMGYAIGTRFESVSNIKLYTSDIGIEMQDAENMLESIFEIGSCVNDCLYSSPVPPRSCPGVNPTGANGWINAGPTKIDQNGTANISFPGA